MLVSSIARFNALNTMNNAAFATMQISNSMLNTVDHTFGGERNLSLLHDMDKRFSLDLLTNNLLYKLAFLQEKMAAKHQNNNVKKSLNVLA